MLHLFRSVMVSLLFFFFEVPFRENLTLFSVQEAKSSPMDLSENQGLKG